MHRLEALLPLALVALAAALPAVPLSAAEHGVARGEYLVNLLGCGRCHTEGHLLGHAATGPHLAGSRVGIAYTDGDEATHPGLLFAPNLTPDEATGLGTWSRRDIVRARTTGVGTDGHQRLPVMPWPNYNALADRDLNAIADYLLSLDPVRRPIPAITAPAESVEHPYVRFGVFVFTPFEDPVPADPDGEEI